MTSKKTVERMTACILPPHHALLIVSFVKYTSLAALGALSHPMQCCTICKSKNCHQGDLRAWKGVKLQVIWCSGLLSLNNFLFIQALLLWDVTLILIIYRWYMADKRQHLAHIWQTYDWNNPNVLGYLRLSWAISNYFGLLWAISTISGHIWITGQFSQILVTFPAVCHFGYYTFLHILVSLLHMFEKYV